jgi:hypothetical protein
MLKIFTIRRNETELPLHLFGFLIHPTINIVIYYSWISVVTASHIYKWSLCHQQPIHDWRQ